MYAATRTRTRHLRTALAGALAGAAMAAGAAGAQAAAPVAVVDTAGSLSGLADATLVSGPASSDPLSHMRLVSSTVRLSGPGQPILGYSCPAGAGIDLTCALAALEDAPARGARVVNFSFSIQQAVVPVSFRARFGAAVAVARSRGVVVLAAAYPGGPTFPADLPGVVSVGAVDRDGERLHPGDNADLYAPGADLEIADGAGRPYYAFGSSFATAFTSGRAATLLDREPALSPDALEARLVGEPVAWPDDPVAAAPVRAGVRRPHSSPRRSTGRLSARWVRGRLVLRGRLPRGVEASVLHRRTRFDCVRLPCRLRLAGRLRSRVPVVLRSGTRQVRVRVPVSRAGRSLRVIRLTRLP